MKREKIKPKQTRMKKQVSLNFFLSSFFFFLLLSACASASKTSTVELENKGTVMGVPTPDWVKLYLEKGLSALQAQPQYKDKYCIVGEESGVNRQFVISLADQASTAKDSALYDVTIALARDILLQGYDQKELQTAAGYNPQSMVEMLRELDKIQGSINTGFNNGFNRTHPSPASRMVNASVAANRYANIQDNGRFREKRFNSVK